VPGGERLFRREERKTPIEIYVNPFAVGSSYCPLIRVYSLPVAP
jgi:hypothetical protein